MLEEAIETFREAEEREGSETRIRLMDPLRGAAGSR